MSSRPVSKAGSVVGATLLIGGTCIGAGMLALPILSALGGFLPAIALHVVLYVFMCATGLLYVEVCLWLHDDANIVSMAKEILGRTAEVITWIVYLCLFYSLTVAYINGSGGMISDLIGGAVAPWVCTIVFAAVFALFVYLGVGAVDRVNLVMMGGLGFTFLVFILLGSPHVDYDLFRRFNWGQSLIALPVILTSFGYQGTVPTLVSYLAREVKKVRIAIVFGSALPFIAYLIWEWLVLGIVPATGENGLIRAWQEGSPPLAPLRVVIGSPWVYIVGEFFAFFALASSLLGVTIGLRDFLADGFNVCPNSKHKLWIVALIFVPATIIALLDPRLFLFILNYGAAFAGTLILGVLPILLVWIGRYHHRMEGPYQLGGGKVTLTLLTVLIGLILIIEVFTYRYLMKL